MPFLRPLHHSLLLLACAVAACSPPPRAATAPAPRMASVESGGLTRTFMLFAPAERGRPAPVMLVFHGSGASAGQMWSSTSLEEAFARHGGITVYADAAPQADRGWAMGCPRCTIADTLGIDDLAFVDAMLAHVRSNHSVDERRVYAVGYSMGGWFAMRLGCTRSGTFAAVVSVAATMPLRLSRGCAPTRAVPLWLLLGLEDEVQPWTGLARGERSALGAAETVARWAELTGCAAPAREGRLTDSTGTDRGVVLDHLHCRDDVVVRATGLTAVGHGWPTGGFSATDEIVRFLMGYALP